MILYLMWHGICIGLVRALETKGCLNASDRFMQDILAQLVASCRTTKLDFSDLPSRQCGGNVPRGSKECWRTLVHLNLTLILSYSVDTPWGWVHSDWAGDTDTRRSHATYIIMMTLLQ